MARSGNMQSVPMVPVKVMPNNERYNFQGVQRNVRYRVSYDTGKPR